MRIRNPASILTEGTMLAKKVDLREEARGGCLAIALFLLMLWVK